MGHDQVDAPLAFASNPPAAAGSFASIEQNRLEYRRGRVETECRGCAAGLTRTALAGSTATIFCEDIETL